MRRKIERKSLIARWKDNVSGEPDTVHQGLRATEDRVLWYHNGR